MPCTRGRLATEERAVARSKGLLTLRALAYQLMHVLVDTRECAAGAGWSAPRRWSISTAEAVTEFQIVPTRLDDDPGGERLRGARQGGREDRARCVART